MRILLKNGQVWLDRTWRSADVLVDEDKIAQIGEHLEATADQVIDAAGKYILPGIIDCHVHLSMNGGPHPMADLGKCREAEATLASIESAQELVRAGITTARDCGGIDRETVIVRDAIKAGRIQGPRVVCCVGAIRIIGGHFYGTEIAGADEARRAAREYVKQGAQYIKLMATAGLGKLGEQPGVAELDVDEMTAAVNVGRKHGMASAAHCHSKEGMMNALDAGVTTLEHCTFLDQEVVDRIVAQDVFVVPTFSPYCQMDRYGAERGVSPYMCKMSHDICQHKEKTFPLAYKSGVKIAFGRDAGAPLVRHGEYYREMLYMEETGMSRTDIIVSATETAAAACQLQDVTGSLAPGKCADILVLDADPLDDLNNFRKVHLVIAAGRMVH